MEDNVKAFSVAYNPINGDNTFSAGDYISGNVTLELAKDCKITSLHVQLKGKARVQWTEHYGRTVVVYADKEKYFSLKQSLIQEFKGQGSESVGKGCHVYPFTFQIPVQDLPPTFKTSHGKVRYRVKAYLSRPMRRDHKANAPFTIISKANADSSPELMTPQHSIKDQTLKLFNSGKVVLDVKIDKMGFRQGEGMQVTAYLQNSSTRDIKPKYCLYLKTSYFAGKKRKVTTKDLVKEVGEPIPRSASQHVTRVISVPPTADVSIFNCAILKHEYRLRVYLDVKYAADPEVKFPVVILPAAVSSPGCLEERPPASWGWGFGDPDLGILRTLRPPPPPTPSSSSYGAYSLYPSLSGN